MLTDTCCDQISGRKYTLALTNRHLLGPNQWEEEAEQNIRGRQGFTRIPSQTKRRETPQVKGRKDEPGGKQAGS